MYTMAHGIIAIILGANIIHHITPLFEVGCLIDKWADKASGGGAEYFG